MVECGRLESDYLVQTGSGVRIPLSPPSYIDGVLRSAKHKIKGFLLRGAKEDKRGLVSQFFSNKIFCDKKYLQVKKDDEWHIIFI